jgi:hypothetical protein
VQKQVLDEVEHWTATMKAAEVLVGELAAQEDAILDSEGSYLAGANAEERERRYVRHGLVEGDGVGAMGRCDGQVGGEGETLPGRWPHRVAEGPFVGAALQPVLSGALLVSPSSGQIGSCLDLVVDDRPIPNRGADDASAGSADSLDEGTQVSAGQKPLPGRGRRARGRARDHSSGHLLRRRLRGGLDRIVSERTGPEAAAGSL